MNFIPKTFAKDLEAEARSYSYDANFFAPLYARIAEKITAYDPSFGSYLANHLRTVAHDAEHFMVHQGYGEDTARKIGHAFALHDIGKIKQNVDLWHVTIDKRNLTPEQKFERTKHVDLGIDVLDETVAELDLNLNEDHKAHLNLAKFLMLTHHERLDGSGPKGLPGVMMDKVLRIVAIVDTVDGKFKSKTLTEIFDDMSGAKHAGQFDDVLVAAYEAYYKKNRVVPAATIQPVLAKTVHSL